MAFKKPKTKYQTVMLIDDNEIDNFINQKMIEGFAFADKVLVHTGSNSALEFFRSIDQFGKLSDEFIPQIIFLDLNMPIMDGFQFIDDFMRMTNRFKVNTRIIMLSSSINPTDLEKAKKNKFITRYVNKPLTEKILAEL